METTKIVIEVYEFGATYRKGNLYVDGRLILKTLEDKDRELSSEMSESEILEKKVPGYTAIPYGTYEVKYRWSNKNKMRVPGLCNVKGFGDIEIHVGNSSADCEGCILVGVQDKANRDWIEFSLTGFRILNNYLCKVVDKPIELTIRKK